MSLNSIRNILNTRMNTLAGSAPIAWENVPYTPTPNTTHFRVNFLPAATRAAANHQSAMNYESGIYQIDLYAPQNQGTSIAGALAETVRTHFYRGLRLTDSSGLVVHIEQSPSMVYSSREGAFWRIQLDVRWFSYTPPPN